MDNSNTNQVQFYIADNQEVHWASSNLLAIRLKHLRMQRTGDYQLGEIRDVSRGTTRKYWVFESRYIGPEVRSKHE